ncbi:MAG: PA14 domain-containing protein [Caldilineaceae bacterium]
MLRGRRTGQDQLLVPDDQPVPDWQASYFDNIDPSGGPVRIVAEPRTNPAINKEWSLDSPFPGVIPADNFSARWTGTFFFDGGDYLFWARADDGVRLWIDDILVLDAWAANPGYVEQTFSQIGRGDHVIRVEYFERGGLARISVDWYRTGSLRSN